MIGLVATFVAANASMTEYLDWSSLLPASGEFQRVSFVWAAMPVFVTAFACAGLVPSLVKHYAEQPRRVNQSLLIGTLLVLFIYLIWLITTFGVLPRMNYAAVIQAGGNIGDLVAALQGRGVSTSLKASLDWFSHFAILTSFLSIGLGLFHFLIDWLRRANNPLGRAQAAAMAFLPPALASYFFPYGFIKAIGYAGLLVALSFFHHSGAHAFQAAWCAMAVIIGIGFRGCHRHFKSVAGYAIVAGFSGVTIRSQS